MNYVRCETKEIADRVVKQCIAKGYYAYYLEYNPEFFEVRYRK